jgi:HEAT repeat protein
MRNSMLRALLLALLLVGAAAGQPVLAAPAGEMAPNDKELNKLYWQGQEALKKSDWAGALKDFQDLERELRAKEPKSADSAVYWQAYTLQQAKRGAEAKAAVERLHREFPDSRWGKEGDALLQRGQPAPAVAATASGGDEELAEMAVEGLMNAPSERALPMLKKVLASQHSDKVKKRALFVLSQLGSNEALDAVIEVARSNPSPELRDEAIRMIGVSGSERGLTRLRELYAESKDQRVKRTIVQAWLVADRKDLVLATARTETDASVRDQAVQVLGAMGASAELEQLLDASKDPATQGAIVQALGVAGDVKGLTAIAEGPYPEATRMYAMQGLGVAGAKEALVKLYAKADSPARREAVLQGLLITGDSKAVVQLYRDAKTSEEKKALLKMITIMDGDEALELIEHELGK